MEQQIAEIIALHRALAKRGHRLCATCLGLSLALAILAAFIESAFWWRAFDVVFCLFGLYNAIMCEREANRNDRIADTFFSAYHSRD